MTNVNFFKQPKTITTTMTSNKFEYLNIARHKFEFKRFYNNLSDSIRQVVINHITLCHKPHQKLENLIWEADKEFMTPSYIEVDQVKIG